MSKKESNIRSFEDLKVWGCARKLQKKVSKLIKIFPKKEKYRLPDQMIRSSRSVPRILQKDMDDTITKKTYNFAGNQGDLLLN